MTGLVTYYVINLDRSPERLAAISDNLSRLGCCYSRVEAVDSQQMPDDEIGRYYDGKFSVDGGCYLKKVWICITLSHERALKAFLNSDQPYGVILEDDAILHQDTPGVVDYLIENHAAGSVEFDMVELAGPDKKGKRDIIKQTTEFGPFKIGKPLKTTPLAAGMIYSRAGAEKILRHALPVRTHWDNYLSLSWRHGARTLTVRPYPITSRAPTVSSIEKDDAIPVPTLWDAFKRRIYRIYQGPRRWCHNMLWMGPAACLKIPGSYAWGERSGHRKQPSER
ncbi:MAG: glycosyltransferase family 25 protein [Stappiaceae bacterium]